MSRNRAPRDSIEWVELIEPETGELMYANINSGECRWELPPKTPVRRMDEFQWWELFDPITKRYYYYNAHSRQTKWNKPTDSRCDIVPLAKLQVQESRRVSRTCSAYTQTSPLKQVPKKAFPPVVNYKRAPAKTTDIETLYATVQRPRRNVAKESLCTDALIDPKCDVTLDVSVESAEGRKEEVKVHQGSSAWKEGSVVLPLHHYILEQAKLLGIGVEEDEEENEEYFVDDGDSNFGEEFGLSDEEDFLDWQHDHEPEYSSSYGDDEILYDSVNVPPPGFEDQRPQHYSERRQISLSGEITMNSGVGASRGDHHYQFSSGGHPPALPAFASPASRHESLRLRERPPPLPPHRSNSTAAQPPRSASMRAPSSVPSVAVDFRDIRKSQLFQEPSRSLILPPKPTRLTSLSTDGPPSLISSHTQSDSVAIERYAQKNLNKHKKGLFRKKLGLDDMLSFSKDPISKPMIVTTNKSLKHDACVVFKLIQVFMGDRKPKHASSSATSGQGGHNGAQLMCGSSRLAWEIVTRGWATPPLRDELLIQICRQTTDNPTRESLEYGWELMALCLDFFAPSATFCPYLQSYIERHLDAPFSPALVMVQRIVQVCYKRLQRLSTPGATQRILRKPSEEDVENSRLHIFRPSMFGSTLDELMALQRDRFPNRQLPWIQTTLSEAVLALRGPKTEGIFRVPGDQEVVNLLKVKLDQWDESCLRDLQDPHVAASLLKLWYRELYEPLIPTNLYRQCMEGCSDAQTCLDIVDQLPQLNRKALAYLIRFLQVFADPSNVALSKMDTSNLSTVFAPNCFRCTDNDPQILLENSRKEMCFVRSLIQHLDTQFITGIV